MGIKMFDRANPVNKQTEIFQDISGGINTELADEVMGDNERRMIVNLDIDSGGYAKKRPGLRRIPWVTQLIWAKLEQEQKNGNIDDLTSLLVSDVIQFYDGANYVVNYITNKGLVVLILTSDMLPVNTNAKTGNIISQDITVVQPVQFYKDILYNVRISDYSTQYILVSSVYRFTPDYTDFVGEKQVRYFSWCPIHDPNGINQLKKGWVEACEQNETPISQTFYGETDTTNISSVSISLVTDSNLVDNFFIGNKKTWEQDSDYYCYEIDSDNASAMFIQCKDIRNEKIIWKRYIENAVNGNYLYEDKVYNVFISVDENGNYPFFTIVYGLDDGVKNITYNNTGARNLNTPWDRSYTISMNVVVDRFNIIDTGITRVQNFPKYMTTAPFGFSAIDIKVNCQAIIYNSSGFEQSINTQSKVINGKNYINIGSRVATNVNSSQDNVPYYKSTISKTNRTFYIEDGCIPIPVNCTRWPFNISKGWNTSSKMNLLSIAAVWDYENQPTNYQGNTTDRNIFYSAFLMELTDHLRGSIGEQSFSNSINYNNVGFSGLSLSSTALLWRNKTYVRYLKSLGKGAYRTLSNGNSNFSVAPMLMSTTNYYVRNSVTNDSVQETNVGIYFCNGYDNNNAQAPWQPREDTGLNIPFNFYDASTATSTYTHSIASDTTTNPSFDSQDSYFTTLTTTDTGRNTSLNSYFIDAKGPNLGELYKTYLGYWSRINSISYDVVFKKSTVNLGGISLYQYNGFNNMTFCWLNKHTHHVLAYKPNPIAFYKLASFLNNRSNVIRFKLSAFFSKKEIQKLLEDKYNIVSFSTVYLYDNNTVSSPINVGIQDYNSIDFLEELMSIENWEQELIEVHYLYFYRYCFKVKIILQIPTNDQTVYNERVLLELQPKDYNIKAIQDGVIKMSFETITGAKAENPALFTQQQYTIPNVNDYSYLWYNLCNFNVRVTGLTPDIKDKNKYPFLPEKMLQYPNTESADNSPITLSSIIPVNNVLFKPGDNQRYQIFWSENLLQTNRRDKIWVNWYIGSLDDYNSMITEDGYRTSTSINWLEMKTGQSGDTPNYQQLSSLRNEMVNNKRVWYSDINIPSSNKIILVQFNMITSKRDNVNEKDPATYRSTSIKVDPASTTETKIDVPSIFDQFVATNKLITFKSSLVSYGKTNKLFFSEISNPTYFPLKWVLEMPTNEAVTSCSIFQNQLVVSTENRKFYISGNSFDDVDNPFQIHSITQEAGAVNSESEHAFQDRLYFHDSSGFKALKNLYSTSDKEFNYETMDVRIKSLIPKDIDNMLMVVLNDKLYIHYPASRSIIVYNAKLKNFTTYQSSVMNFKKMYVVNGKLYCISAEQGMSSNMFKIWYFDEDTYVDDWNPEEDGYKTIWLPFEDNKAHRVQDGVLFECYIKTKNIDLGYPYHSKKLNEITVTTSTDKLTTVIQPEIEFDDNRVNYSMNLYRDLMGKLVYEINNPDAIVIRTGTKLDTTWVLGSNKLGDQNVTQHKINIGKAARTFALGLRHKYPLPITFMNFNIRYSLLLNRANSSKKIS